MIVVEMDKVCDEMLNVMASHRIPVSSLDSVLAYLKDLALTRTPIQNANLEQVKRSS